MLSLLECSPATTDSTSLGRAHLEFRPHPDAFWQVRYFMRFEVKVT